MGEKEMRESKPLLEDPTAVSHHGDKEGIVATSPGILSRHRILPCQRPRSIKTFVQYGQGKSNGADTAAETSSSPSSSSSSSSCHVDLPAIIVFDLDDCLWYVVFSLRLVFTVFVQSAEVIVPKA